MEGPVFGEEYSLFSEESGPVFEETHAIVLSETSHIGEISRSQHGVTKHTLLILLQDSDRLLPSVGLVGKTNDKFFGSLKFELDFLLITRELIKLLLSFGVVTVQARKFVFNLAQSCLFLVELLLHYCKFLLSSG